MKHVLLLIMAVSLCLPVSGLAQKENIGLNDVIQTLEKPFREDAGPNEMITDFQADFFQQSRLASLDREQRGRGRVEVRFDRTSAGRVPLTQFRWDYEQPNNQEIVSDGRTLWVYLPENNRVIQSDIEFVNNARADDPMTFLTGLGNLSRDFQISWASPNQDTAGNYVLRLQPRRVSALIREMFVVVDREAVFDFTRHNRTGQIFPFLSTSVTDPNDNTTLIEFNNIRVNRRLSPGSFRFIMPAGVEVVRPTGQPMGY